MARVAQIIRSSADWYAPFVDEGDMGEHNVDENWGRENFEKREFFVGVLRAAGDAVGVENPTPIVGTVTMQDTGDYTYLGYVYLHADHTGQGLGTRLLDFARRESARRGDRGMVLIAHPEADWAIRAYERYGFSRIAHTDDAVLAWNEGWLEPYHEKGFHLYRYLHGAA